MNRALVCLVMGGCAFLGGAVAVSVSPKLQAQLPSAAPSPSAAAELTTLSERFEAIARRLAPAVVSIEAIKPSGTKPDGKPRTVEDSGSGVLIAADDGRGALVITNNHVVTGAAIGQISVNLSDGRLLRPTQVLADPETDVALLRVDGAGLPLAPLGDSDRARVGQWVLAVGSPFGLNQSVTHGIISARERGSVSLGTTIRIKDFLQTDAAINPGSSGGPLVNLDGEVIGINTAIASQSGSNSGVAFSIPINLVRRVARQLQERGQVSRGYLGLQLAQSFEPTDAIKLGLDRGRGARVDAVYPGTPAEQAGLKVNDVVLQVDGVAVRNDNHLINLISMLPAGQRVRLQVWRERRVQSLDAVIGDWAAAQVRFRAPAPQQ
ncbi:MAG TPA: trypsin-like peptidase domain-containing protein [Gemmataceae bacterium]|nr:trypsin-like peptidase domain-containing protein [Gemmataceae bacterium]